jgi:hypothetical protein
MKARMSTVLVVVMLALAGLLNYSLSPAMSQAKPVVPAVWRIAQVEPATKESKDPDCLGSIFVVRSDPESATNERMWLRITTKTIFSINGNTKGVKVEDLVKGVIVVFQFSGTTKTLPPMGIATEVHASVALGR